jgi:hypothetical protein
MSDQQLQGVNRSFRIGRSSGPAKQLPASDAARLRRFLSRTHCSVCDFLQSGHHFFFLFSLPGCASSQVHVIIDHRRSLPVRQQSRLLGAAGCMRRQLQGLSKEPAAAILMSRLLFTSQKRSAHKNAD